MHLHSHHHTDQQAAVKAGQSRLQEPKGEEEGVGMIQDLTRGYMSSNASEAVLLNIPLGRFLGTRVQGLRGRHLGEVDYGTCARSSAVTVDHPGRRKVDSTLR